MWSKTLSHVYNTPCNISGQDKLRWATWTLKWVSINRGGPYKITASVNVLPTRLHYNNYLNTYALSKAVILHYPPQLIDFRRWFFVTVSVNKK